jgi:hypothetical protein
MSDPFREARLEPAEVRRILRRAAELAETDGETAAVERPLARAELEELAAGLGIPRTAVARAIDGGEDAAPTPAPRRGNAFLGGPTHILVEADVDGEPSDADREELVEIIERVLGENGTSASAVGKTFTWRLAPAGNRGRDVSVRLRSRDGRTRVVVEERLARQATGLFVGLGVGAGVGPMGGYIAVIATLGLLGVLAPVLWIALMLGLARTIFGWLARKRGRQLNEVLGRIQTQAAGWSAPAARARVASAASAAAEGAAPEAPEEELTSDETTGTSRGARA